MFAIHVLQELEDVKRLVVKMLDKDPVTRPSIEMVLSEPLFARYNLISNRDNLSMSSLGGALSSSRASILFL